jgi:hypothetical protein
MISSDHGILLSKKCLSEKVLLKFQVKSISYHFKLDHYHDFELPLPLPEGGRLTSMTLHLISLHLLNIVYADEI